MALTNRVFSSGVAEYENSTIAEHNYENDNSQMSSGVKVCENSATVEHNYENDNGQLFRRNGTSTYQDLQTNKIQIYQKLVSTSQIEFINGTPNEGYKALSPEVQMLSLQEESQLGVAHIDEQLTTDQGETTGKRERNHPHRRRSQKALLIIFLAMLFFLLSALVILLLTTNIGPQLDDKIMMQVDGEWTDWSVWTVCRGRCGQGNQDRHRSCTNPPSSNGGRNCVGFAKGTRRCDTGRQCDVDGEWTDWSMWTVCRGRCGQGNQDRHRSCTNHSPFSGGRNCEGSATETRICDTGRPCSDYGYWGSWGAWSKCSKNCHQGKHYRERKCLFKPHNGPIKKIPCSGGSHRHEEPCNVNKPCLHYGYWGAWGAWSKCSKNCHQGKHYRERKCLFKPHNGPIKKILCTGGSHRHEEPCNINKPCLHYGYWSSWGAWSKCSKNCHKGYRERRRTCLYKPSNGPVRRVKCKGGDLHKGVCNLYKTCYLQGYWASWGSWGGCSTKCGRGTRRRQRSCTFPQPYPRPFYKGVPCKGSSYIVGACNLQNPCAGAHSGCYDKLGSYRCIVKQPKGYCKDNFVKNYHCRRTCCACVATPYKPYDSLS